MKLHIKPSRIGAEKLARLSTPAIEAFRDDLFILSDAAEDNAAIILLISQRNLPKRIGPGAVLHKHVIPVFFSHNGSVGHSEFVIRVAGQHHGRQFIRLE